jgi:hypothetical protein
MGGAAGPKTIAHMVEFCDGWMPLSTRHDLEGNLTKVRAVVEAGGRDPAAFTIITYGAKGTPETVEHLIKLGVDRIVFNLPQREPAEVLDRIANMRELIRDYR